MRKRAFTLIEMLVVILIIGLLMAIVSPVLRYVRQQSLLVICGSNINQLSRALAMYEQNNNSFPYGYVDLFTLSQLPSSGYVGEPTKDTLGWWWFNFLEKTIGSEPNKGSTFWCPARIVQDRFLTPNILCGNYGVNQAICKNTPFLGGAFVGKPLNLSSIRKPSQTLLIVDSGYALISWKAAAQSSGPIFGNPQRVRSFYVPGMEINKNRSIEPGFGVDAIYGRHIDRLINVVFADGHLSALKPDDLFIEKNTKPTPLWLPR